MFKIVLVLSTAGVCLGQSLSGAYLPSSSGKSSYAGAIGSLQHRAGGRSGSFGSQYSSVGGTTFGSRSAGGYGSSSANQGYGSSARNQYGRQGGYGDDGNSEPASYEFKYDVNEPEYGVEFGHEEKRDGDNTNGAYYVLLPDGRRQLVEYTADASGYHPRISYTESASSSGRYQGSGGYQSGGNYQSGRSQTRGGYQGGNTRNRYQTERTSQTGGYQSGY